MRNSWSGLSRLEELVMGAIWSMESATAEDVRTALADRHPMKDSTARTILRRLEGKGYLQHCVEGRTYRFRPVAAVETVAAGAVRRIIDRLCNGSVEQLLIGMVDSDVVDEAELERLVSRIASSRRGKERRS